MSRKGKLSDKKRIKAVQEYLDRKGSYFTIAKKYGVSKNTIGGLVNRAKSEGINAIRISKKIRNMTKIQKYQQLKNIY